MFLSFLFVVFGLFAAVI